jgi:hypothetical protein
MRYFLKILLYFYIFSGSLFSRPDSSSYLKIDLAGGYSRSIYNQGSYQFGEYSRAGFGGMFRIIWQSENILGLGIESGYLPLASLRQDNFSNEFGKSDIRANISAIPILADFSFDFGKFYFNTSAGYYLVSSRINAFGEKSFSSTFDFGFSFSFGYKKMFNNHFGFGGEFKSHHLVDTPQLAFSIQVNLIYKINL